jgi:hypothetical protein
MEIEKTFPIRKGTRLRGFDYSKEGAYFLTICTQNRKSILAKIVGGVTPPATIPLRRSRGQMDQKDT